MIKKLFCDIETTGLSKWRDDIVEFAAIILVDEVEVERAHIYAQPRPETEMKPDAIAAHGLTLEKLQMEGVPQEELYTRLKELFTRYVNPFQKGDKFHFVGFNSTFDMDFLRSLWKHQGDAYFGSFFFWPDLDVARLAGQFLLEKRHKMESFQLENVALTLGLGVEPAKTHGASYDIDLTKKIYDIVTREEVQNGTGC